MRQTHLILIAAAASALAGFGLGGALPTREAVATAPLGLPPTPAPGPLMTPGGGKPAASADSLGPLLAPIWARGRISGFVAAEITVELAPGAARTELLPAVQDAVLTALYRAGAEGRLEPGSTDPDALQRDLLHAARGSGAGGAIQGLRIARLLHQENRPR